MSNLYCLKKLFLFFIKYNIKYFLKIKQDWKKKKNLNYAFVISKYKIAKIYVPVVKYANHFLCRKQYEHTCCKFVSVVI